jgi:protein-disulfide isomerase
MVKIFAALLIAAAVAPAADRDPVRACPPLTQAEIATLARYVQTKYHVTPPEHDGLIVSVAEEGADANCYRHLRFSAPSPQRPFAISLYLEPDHRHLSTDLFDSALDPLVEERRLQRETSAALTQGVQASAGRPDAQVTLVVFTDYQCPYCRKMAQLLDRELASPTGSDLRVIYRHFPLRMHTWAESAAEASVCASFQGIPDFQKMHALIFEHQKEVTNENVAETMLELAGSAGVDVDAYRKCTADAAAAAVVHRDIELGSSYRVAGTPTLFINGRRAAGIHSQDDLHAAIVGALAEARESTLAKSASPPSH